MARPGLRGCPSFRQCCFAETDRFQVDVVNLLVDRGAEINARGMYGDTALHLA